MPVTRTFLFTDIEGSTRSEQHDPVAWASNHEQHNQIIEEIVRENNGEVYKNTGDGYQAAFVNALFRPPTVRGDRAPTAPRTAFRAPARSRARAPGSP